MMVPFAEVGNHGIKCRIMEKKMTFRSTMLPPVCTPLGPKGGQEASVCSWVSVDRVWIYGLGRKRSKYIYLRLSIGYSLRGKRRGPAASPQLETSSHYPTMFQHRTPRNLRIKIVSVASGRTPIKISLSKKRNASIPITEIRNPLLAISLLCFL